MTTSIPFAFAPDAKISGSKHSYRIHKLACFEGDLYGPSTAPLRRRYSWHYRQIDTAPELFASLRAGQFAWPGGYEVYFITSDGAVLSYEAVVDELRSVVSSIRDGSNDGWRVVGLDCTANTDGEVRCEHTNRIIQEEWQPDSKGN